MGRNARIRKLRRLARRQFEQDNATGTWASEYQKKHPDTLLIPGNKTEKMSEVLEEFAEPLLRQAQTPEDTKKALTIAMVAWNYSFLDEAARADQDGPQATLFADPMMRELFEVLLARKQELYPDNQRIILDFQLIPNGSEFQFNVISTLPPGTVPSSVFPPKSSAMPRAFAPTGSATSNNA